MSAMPTADYMRMLTDFQAQGGVVGQNATKKLQEAQAIINANQGGNGVKQAPMFGRNATQQITAAQEALGFNQLKNQPAYVGGGSPGFYNNQAAQTTQYPLGTGQNPFSFSQGTITYSDYDPITNTIGKSTGGIAGNIDEGRQNVADLINSANVFQGDGVQNLNNAYYNEEFANAFNQYQNQANVNTGGNTGFDTTLPTQAPVGSTVSNLLTNLPDAPSSPSAGTVAGTTALGGLLSGNFNLQNVLGAAGQAYLGQEAISAPYEVGKAGLEMAEQVGTRALENSAFKPYTVTSNLAKVGTDASGGFTTQLSPEQQALQNQIMGQAGGFFSQLQADPAAVQAGIYEDIRATQRPEEERQRLALEERMLSQGRLGLSSDAYGGASPELLAMETARQEAMARANVGARQQALAEQAQTASLAGGLLSSGYTPQSQALALLEASQIPAGLQQKGQLAGVDLQSQLGSAGIESLLQGSQTAEAARLAMLQNLTASITGRQDPLTGSFAGGLLSSALQQLPSWLGGGETSSTSDYSFLADAFGFGSANPSQINTGLLMGFTPEQIANAMNNPTSFEDNIDYSGSDYDY